MQYINRRGDTYFAFQGTTKTGKPKYFASKQPANLKATRVTELPSEYEIFESPVNAMVVIRRRKQSVLTAADRNLLSRLALEHCQVACEAVIDGNSLIVYVGPPRLRNSALKSMVPGIDFAIRNGFNLEPGFKFTLVDVEKRTFTVERYCYRGAIDGWWDLHIRPAVLESLAAKYLPHLGQESFFELD